LGDPEGTGLAAGCFSDTVMPAWSCTGIPSVCDGAKNDGVILGYEQCDDGNQDNGDGCSVDGQVEPGFACSGEPSTCTHACSDGNAAPGDGCFMGAVE